MSDLIKRALKALEASAGEDTEGQIAVPLVRFLPGREGYAETLIADFGALGELGSRLWERDAKELQAGHDEFNRAWKAEHPEPAAPAQEIPTPETYTKEARVVVDTGARVVDPRPSGNTAIKRGPVDIQPRRTRLKW